MPWRRDPLLLHPDKYDPVPEEDYNAVWRRDGGVPDQVSHQRSACSRILNKQRPGAPGPEAVADARGRPPGDQRGIRRRGARPLCGGAEELTGGTADEEAVRAGAAGIGRCPGFAPNLPGFWSSPSARCSSRWWSASATGTCSAPCRSSESAWNFRELLHVGSSGSTSSTPAT